MKAAYKAQNKKENIILREKQCKLQAGYRSKEFNIQKCDFENVGFPHQILLALGR